MERNIEKYYMRSFTIYTLLASKKNHFQKTFNIIYLLDTRSNKNYNKKLEKGERTW